MAYHSVRILDNLKVFDEYDAAAAITPGMLIELTSAGKVQAHSNAGQNMIPMFAFEDEEQGNGIDDDYDSGDPVKVWIPQRGDKVYAILADGEDVSKGDFLESDGNGYLKKHVPDKESIGTDSSGNVNSFYTNQIVAQALEDLDLSASSAAESSGLQGNQRLIVRIV
jgi:hypothetical protein